jgi:rubrerythrin
MDDVIKRQWIMECVNEGWIKFDTEKDENRFIHLVRDIAPSAQPEPKEGHWIKHKIRDQQFIQNGYELVRCSECGMETTANELAGISLFGEEEPHYCPNCGARMKGERQK